MVEYGFRNTKTNHVYIYIVQLIKHQMHTSNQTWCKPFSYTLWKWIEYWMLNNCTIKRFWNTTSFSVNYNQFTNQLPFVSNWNIALSLKWKQYANIYIQVTHMWQFKWKLYANNIYTSNPYVTVQQTPSYPNKLLSKL